MAGPQASLPPVSSSQSSGNPISGHFICQIKRLYFSQPDCFLILLILAMDTATGATGAVEVTARGVCDSLDLPELLNQIPPDEEIGTVTGDGAFDTRGCHTASPDHRATAIIPIRKNGRVWTKDCPAATARNDMPYARPSALVAPPGTNAQGIMSEAGSRRRYAASIIR